MYEGKIYNPKENQEVLIKQQQMLKMTGFQHMIKTTDTSSENVVIEAHSSIFDAGSSYW